MSFNAPEEISDEEWERTFAVNISAMFYLVKAAGGDRPRVPRPIEQSRRDGMCAEMLLRVYLGQIFSVPHDRNGS
jgi:NAD(P)-dependent dehydrogenase (short-subunit alcohol dehydrogenase family)